MLANGKSARGKPVTIELQSDALYVRCQQQENQIRHAAGSSTRYIEQQNTELKRMLEKNHK